jgi:hypothetical protein
MTEKEDIQDLISRYSDAITRRDWEVVASVFAADGSWQVVGNDQFSFAGAKIGPGIRSLVEPANYLIQLNTPALIDISGETATARSTIMEIAEYEAGKFKEFKARLNSYGFYQDVIKKLNGKWLFTSRRFNMITMTLSRVDD